MLYPLSYVGGRSAEASAEPPFNNTLSDHNSHATRDGAVRVSDIAPVAFGAYA